MHTNNNEVVTRFGDLVHDVNESNHITLGDGFILLHLEIEVNVSTFVSNSTLEEGGFTGLVVKGLLVRLDVENLSLNGLTISVGQEVLDGDG